MTYAILGVEGMDEDGWPLRGTVDFRVVGGPDSRLVVGSSVRVSEWPLNEDGLKVLSVQVLSDSEYAVILADREADREEPDD